MPKGKKSDRRYRAVLSETLPYEVPAIFSNDRFYYSLTGQISSSVPIEGLLEKLRGAPSFTKPYEYRIAKDPERFTTLGIIHPLNQIAVADFYESFSRAILSACSKSPFSLRRPSEIAKTFSPATLVADASKHGIAHLEVDEGETDVSHYVNYFIYQRYNLINRFFDSAEMIRLEKRFRRMRTLDISRCFQNIYTHSETWAVRSKEFAKRHQKHFSFEGEFDRIMRQMNYNETAGIVIGPEVSRIFAETILQDVDRRVHQRLTGSGMIDNRNYAVRRYVDDYFVFAHNAEDIEAITSTIADELEAVKLYLNDKKRADFESPFVTPISLARSEISSEMAVFDTLLQELKGDCDTKQIVAFCRDARAGLRTVRQIVTKYEIGFSAISGWFLGRVKRLLRGLLESGALSKHAPTPTDDVLRLLVTLVEVAFYVCALDTRVRATYNICQITDLVLHLYRNDAEYLDVMHHAISDELLLLLRRRLASGLLAKPRCDDVEVYNLLICGAHYVGTAFLRSEAAQTILAALSATDRPSYFGYITAKFCLRKDEVLFASQLSSLNIAVAERLTSAGRDKIMLDAELYLLLCDYLSAPDLSVAERREMFVSVFGGNPSNAEIEALADHVGFVDWDGLSIEHLLRRRELRPVYASA